MEFAKTLEQTCQEKHVGVGCEPHKCVYDSTFRELIELYPAYENLLKKLHFQTITGPDYDCFWKDLQDAYPQVPGLYDLKTLGHRDPKFDTLIEKVKDLEPSDEVKDWFNFNLYLDSKQTRGSEDAQLWELTEDAELLVKKSLVDQKLDQEVVRFLEVFC